MVSHVVTCFLYFFNANFSFSLFSEERQKLISEVEKEWKQICKKGDIENELYEDINDCITKVQIIVNFYLLCL